jgi:hypothetical protein
LGKRFIKYRQIARRREAMPDAAKYQHPWRKYIPIADATAKPMENHISFLTYIPPSLLMKKGAALCGSAHKD